MMMNISRLYGWWTYVGTSSQIESKVEALLLEGWNEGFEQRLHYCYYSYCNNCPVRKLLQLHSPSILKMTLAKSVRTKYIFCDSVELWSQLLRCKSLFRLIPILCFSGMTYLALLFAANETKKFIKTMRISNHEVRCKLNDLFFPMYLSLVIENGQVHGFQ